MLYLDLNLVKIRYYTQIYAVCTSRAAQLLQEADDQLFERILNNPHHTLYQLFPPQSAASQKYNIRCRKHDRRLHEHQRHLSDLLRGYCTKIHTNSIIIYIVYCKL